MKNGAAHHISHNGPIPIDAADKICGGELPTAMRSFSLLLNSEPLFFPYRVDYCFSEIHVGLLMNGLEQTCASLRAQIAATEAQLAGLRRELETAEQAAAAAQHAVHHDYSINTSLPNGTRRWPLEAEEYRRYGRQMIVPQLGIQGGL